MTILEKIHKWFNVICLDNHINLINEKIKIIDKMEADYKTEMLNINKSLKNLKQNYTKLQIAASHNPKAAKILKKESESKSKLQSWSKRVREVGKCDVCESIENLTAHHLYDKNTHPTLSYQDENGVCLCETCHNNFHKMYTSASQTTPKQYEKFKIIELNKMK